MAARRRRAAPKPTPSRRSRIGRYLGSLLLKLCLLVAVFAVVYGAWLDLSVRSQFEGRRWQVPARIYARAAELYVGAAMDPEVLEQELKGLGYERTWSRS